VVDAPAPGYGTFLVLLVLIAISVWIGTAAQRAVRRGQFLTGFFLGHRGLGAWALALTATVQSGGTFMGFPSLVYSSGWVVALWISSYMVVPITGFAVLGKRFAQLSRRTGAITVPDMFRVRFASPTVGLVASLLIMFFIVFMMIAQFKAGAILMKLAWPGTGTLALAEDSPARQLSAASLDRLAARGVPAAVVRKLRPLAERAFVTDQEFSAELARRLSSAELRKHQASIVAAASPFDWLFLAGLAIFSVTVVGYTLMGGFLASVWTDLFQSVLMAIGVVVLFLLVVPAASRHGRDQPTRQAVAMLGPNFAFPPGLDKQGQPFLPGGAALSFFFVWVFGGLGMASGMVRVMACRDTATMRRSIVLLSFYNLLIYLPLTVICVAAHSVMPPLDKSDEVIPRLAIWGTQGWRGGSLVAGLILAAPFGAVMASVSSFLVLIASGLVRDVYHQLLRPRAGEAELRRASRLAMLAVGAVAFAANIRPVDYLQFLIVLSSEASAAALAVPAIMVAYWRRATAAGVVAAMLLGSISALWPFAVKGIANPLVAGLRPIVFGLAASLVAGVVVSLATTPPPAALVSRLFDTPKTTG
jgi:SSS family solute:Na+ symporter/sodium/pantothenate symporter